MPQAENVLALQEQEVVPVEEDQGLDWLAIAKDAYRSSDDYFGSSLATQVQKNLALFNSRHPSGSKYHSDAYRYRSRIFRPKTRSSIRRHEAAAVEAYFSTEELILCESENEGDARKSLGAHASERLLNYRLKQPSFMWFQTLVGAYQDAMVQGAVISRQEWKYQIEQSDGPGESNVTVKMDQSGVDLVPLENVRFDSNSDWRDPINSSPFLIEIIPMYRGDVKGNMDSPDKDPSKSWHKVSDEEMSRIETAQDNRGEGVSDSRRDNRQDPKDVTYETSDYDLVWVHRNIIRMEGIDYIYYTLGTDILLSDPIPLSKIYPQGRPYVMGFANLETHKCLPASYTELVGGIQQEINEIANSRLDNVKLVVNRRSFVRRNAKVDTRAMTRSVPGGVVLVENIDTDVRYDAPPDVTSSSYQEQDRLNSDFDELAGSFSGSSVGSNRQLNETVGGMEIMNSDASSVSGYQLMIFAETWVKPIVRQLLSLEQAYVSDLGLLQVLVPETPPRQTLMAMQDTIRVKLNVGFGSTSPARRIEKMTLAIQTLAGVVPDIVNRLDDQEIIKEVFGALGYQDGKRFLKDTKENPEVTALKKQVQELSQLVQGRQMELDNKVQVANIKREGDLQKEQIRSQAMIEIAMIQREMDHIDALIDAEQNEIKLGQLYLQRMTMENNLKIKQMEMALNRREGVMKMLMDDKSGLTPGIEERPGPG